MRKLSKIKKILIVLLGAVVIAAVSIFGIGFINFNNDNTDIADADAYGTSFALASAGSLMNVTYLCSRISGTGTLAAVNSKLASATGGVLTYSTMSNTFNVTVNSLHFNPVYVSKDASGNIIVTFWAAGATSELPSGSFNTYTTNSGTYPCTDYNYSQGRALLVGSSYATSSTALVSGTSKQHTAYKTLIANYGAYMVAPSAVSWHSTESYMGTAWKSDKLWLPSTTECGTSASTGLWKCNGNQYKADGWTRIRNRSTSDESKIYSIGTSGSAAAYSVTDGDKMRPAFHFNLTKAYNDTVYDKEYVDAWNAAVTASSASSPQTFKLTRNWNAGNDAHSFGEGVGFTDGTIYVPAGKSMIIDLNGYNLDRKLTSTISNGRVLTVYGTLVVKDTSSSAAGKITGGYSSTGAGGVSVYSGGTFTLQSGNIANNKNSSTQYPGAGVCVWGGIFNMSGGNIYSNTINSYYGGGVGVSDQSGSKFTMSGGKIYSNTAKYGGGVVNENTSTTAVTLSGGTIGGSGTPNNATNGGGGVYTIAGTTTLSGTTISYNTASNSGGGVRVSEGAVFTMTSGNISKNSAPNGGGIYVDKTSGTSTANLNGGTIGGSSLGNSATYGGGVFAATGGTVNIAGTTISYNTDKNSSSSSTTVYYGGGGVYVGGGTVKLSSGSVSYNTARNGGAGVYAKSGSFTMSGGSIANNTVTNNTTSSIVSKGGGGVYVNGATVSMTGGSIKDNTSSGFDGGGVHVNSGSFTMNGSGALISSNECVSGTPQYVRHGGGVHVYGGTFTLTQGTISGNNAYYGAGIAARGGSFTMNGSGAYIKDNTTLSYGYGGGVYTNGGTFTLTQGTISGNTCGYNGGGIYVSGSNTVVINGGTITGNRANNGYGGGIYTSYTFKIKGNVAVYNNYRGSGTTKSNIYTGGYNYITVSGALTSNSNKIGIDGCGVFTTGYKTYCGTTSPSTYFSSDDGYSLSLYSGTATSKQGEVQIGTLMTVSSPSWSDGGSSTKSFTYNGSAQGGTYNAVSHASVSTTTGITHNTSTRSVTAINVYFSSSTSISSSSATSISSYSITFTPSSGYCWADGSGCNKALYIKILPKQLTVTWSNKSLVYSGAAQKATATVSGLIGSDTCSLTMSGGGTNVGTYSVKAVSTNKNYCLGSATTSSATYYASISDFTITKATLTDTTADVSTTYDRLSHTITVSATGFKASQTISTGTITYSTAENGTYSSTKPTVTNVADSKTIYYKVTFTNYNTITGGATVTISPRSLATGTTFTAIANQTYTGSAITPSTTVSNSGIAATTKTLTLDTDYTRTYSDNINAGTATITFTGKGNFTGTASTTFTILKATLTDSTAAVSVVYDRAAHGITLNITGFKGSDTLASEGTIKYGTVSGTYNQDVCPTVTDVSEGVLTVYYQVTFDNYNTVAGSKTVTITPRSIASNTTITVSGEYVYNSTALTPTYTVSNSALAGTDKYLARGTDFSYAYTNNTNAGTATITLTGMGNFTGTATQTFTIQKATLTDISTGYDGVYDRTAHTISVSVTGFFGSDTLEGVGTITYSVLENGTFTSTHPSVINVADSKDIFYKITFANYNTITGSKAATITQRNIANGTTVSVSGEYVYTSKEITPTYTVTNSNLLADNKTLVRGTAFTVEYSNNINAGTATMVLMGMGNFTGLTTQTFTIQKADLNDSSTSFTGIYDREPHGINVNAAGFRGSDEFSMGTVKYGTASGVYDLAECPTATDVSESGKTVYYQITFDNYNTITGSKTITITPRSIAGGTAITVSGTYIYNASEQIPSFTVTNSQLKGDNLSLIMNDDFTAAYTNNLNAGTATITLTGKGNFSGTATQTFEIEKADLTDTSTGYSGIYDRIFHTINVSVSGFAGGDTLANSGTVMYGLNEGSYTLDEENQPKVANVYNSNKEVFYLITFDNYNTITGSKTIVIIPRDISEGTDITVNGTYVYNASAQIPNFTVNNSYMPEDNQELVKDIAFTAAYTNNVNAGTATITLTGKGNFDGTTTISANFIIQKAQITSYLWDNVSYVYDGNEKQPKIKSVTTTATAGLPANHADMFTYSGAASDTGDYTATAVLKDEYAKNYEITSATDVDKKQITIGFMISDAVLVAAVTAYVGVYDGKRHKLLTKIEASVTEGTEVEWYWSDKNIGKNDEGWTRFYSADGPYLAEVCEVSDTKTYYFMAKAANYDPVIIPAQPTVTPKSMGTGANAIPDITYDGIPQLIYDGTAKTPTPAIHDTVATNNGKDMTVNDYEFVYSNNIFATKSAVITVKGKGNYSGSFQILYTIEQKDIADGSVTVTDIADQIFANKDWKLSPTVTDTVIGNADLAVGTDYTVVYNNSDGNPATDFKNVGKITVIITGKGNYTGERTVEYNIISKQIDEEDAVTVADIAAVTFNGNQFTPEPAVKTIFGSSNVTLVKGTDFDYSYSDNRNAGTATVTITAKGNYSGTVSVNFVINPKRITSVSGITADDKVYDGTLGYENAVKENGENAEAAGLHFDSAIISGNMDGSDLVVQTATGVFDNKNTGSRTVTVTVTALGGAMSGNYVLPENGVKITLGGVRIKAREILIEWGELEHVYDGRNYVPTASVANLADGDRVELVTRLKGVSSAVVPGPYQVEIATVLYNENGNYALPSVTFTQFNIITENTSVRIDTDSLTQVFDGTPKLPSLQELLDTSSQTWGTLEDDGVNYTLTFEALNGGSLVEIGGKHIPVNAGEYKVKVVVSPNFIWSDMQGGDTREFTFTIERATLSGFEFTGATHTYTGNQFTLSVDWSGAALDGVAIGGKPDGVEVVYFYDGAAANGVSNAGNHTVTAKFNVNGNYNAIADITVNLIIEKAELSLDGISLPDGTAAFDGNTHKLFISGTLPDKLKVVYSYEKDGLVYGANGVSGVGVYTVKATFAFADAADGDNYKLVKDGSEVSYLTATLEITKQSAEVSDVEFNDKTVVYDGNIHKLQVSGAAEGITSVTYEYKKGGVAISADGVKNAGVYTVTATFETDDNYAPVAPMTATLVISKKPLKVTADDKTIIYGDNPADGAYTATFSGLASGDTVSSLGTLNIRVNAGIYAIFGSVGLYANAIEASGLSGAATENYDITYIAGTLNVKPRVIEVVWYNDGGKTAQDLIYTYSEGEVHTPYASVVNAVNGNTVFVTVEGGQINAGIDYVARATGVSNSNYTLPVNGLTVKFTVNPKPKAGVIIWSQSPLYYNGGEQAPEAYFYESENSYAPVKLEVTVNGKAVNVGSYVATASLGSNYHLTGETTKTFTIERRDVYINIGDMTAQLAESIDVSGVRWTYVDGSLEFVAGESYTLTFTCPAVTGTGTYPIRGEFRSSNAANYNVHFTGGYSLGEDSGKCGVLKVVEGAYDMSKVSFTGTEVTYDGNAHVIGVRGLPAGVTATFEYSLNGWSYGANGVTEAGVYTVTVKFTGANENYAQIADMTVTLNIRKAALTVKANDVNIVYGDMPVNGGASFSIEGLENTDALSGTLAFEVDYLQYGNAGKYKIIPSGLTSRNYEIIFVPGTLTVSPREIGAVWYSDDTTSSKDLTYNYDGNSHLPFAVAVGTLRGDIVTFTVTGAKTEAGFGYTAKITGVSNPNYKVKASEASVKFNIIRKNYVIWDNSPLVYNGENQAPAAYYFDDEGVKHDLTVTVNGEHKNAGVEYTATATGVPAGVEGSAVFNYTIEKVKLEITVGGGSLVYGKVESGLAALLAKLKNELIISGGGFLAADVLPVTLNCLISNTSAVGEYVITAVCTNGNYEVVFINGTLTITKADIDVSGVTFSGQSAVYDGKLHSVTANNLPQGISGVIYSYKKDGVEISADGVIDAGSYTVTVKFAADSNHNAVDTELTVNITVTQADLNGKIKFDGKTVTYDGREHYLYVTGSTEGVLGISYKYDDGKGTVTDCAVKAGTYTVTAEITVSDNFKPVGNLTAQLKIEKAALTVTASDGAVVYGQTPSANGYGYSVNGLAASDSVSDILGAFAFSYETIDGVGEYVITISGATSAENYNVVYKSGKLIVTPYVISENDIIWLDKEGGTALGSSGKFEYTYTAGVMMQPHAEVKVLVNGETVTLTVEGGKIAVGYGYEAVITEITGEFAANYALPAESLKVIFDILPRPVSGKIIWDYEPLYYNGEKQIPHAYYFMEEGGTRYELDVTVNGPAINVGSYTATVSLKDTNYTLTGSTSINFNIVPRPVYIVVGDAEIRYGGNVSSDIVSWSYSEGSMRFVNGDAYSINFLFGEINGIGKYPISAQFVCDKSENYNVTFVGSWASAGADNGKFGTLTVIKAVYDMSGVTFAGTETAYDGKTHKIIINGLPEGVTAVCEYVSKGFGYGTNGVKNAGVYTVNITYSGNENYEDIAPVTATLTIRKASLTVKANDGEITYGEEPKNFGITCTGLVAGESAADVLNGELGFTFGYVKGSSVGNYSFTPYGLSAENYEINYRVGTLKVVPKPVTVTWYDDETESSQNFVYYYDGTTSFVPHAVAGGLIEGDSVLLTVSGGQRFAGLGYVAKVTGLSNPNYALPVDGSGQCSFDVMTKPYNIVWDNTPIYYNGEVQMPKAYYFDEEGVRRELVVTVTKESKDVGEYIARAMPRDDDPNKDLISGDSTHGFTILKLKVSVIIDSVADIIYGEQFTLSQNGWSYAAGSAHFAAGDGNPVVLSSVATTVGVAAGRYAITGKCGNSNYEVEFTEGWINVKKASPDLSGVEYGKLTVTYDGLSHALEITGLPSYLKAVCTYIKNGVVMGINGVIDAGEYKVIITFTADSDNYEIPENVEKTFTINKKQSDLSGIRFDDIALDYDGNVKNIYVTGTAEGVANAIYTYYKADGVTELIDGAIDAGVYKVKVEFEFDDNHYGSGEPVWAELTVNKAQLTVTANDGSVVYGQNAVAGGYGYTVEGLAFNDSADDVLGNIVFSFAAYEGAGEHENVIELSGNNYADNYVIEYVFGTLTVTPREITATWQKSETDTDTNLAYTYEEGKVYIPYAVAGNTVNGDTLVLKAEVEREKVGDGYVAVVTGIYLADGVTAAANYKLPAEGIRTVFTVAYENPVEYEIVWNYSTMYYDGTAKKPTASYYDGAVGKFISVKPENIGVYDKDGRATQAVNAGDYVAKIINSDEPFVNADEEFSFSVTPRSVYITIGDISIKFGETPDMSAVSWTYASQSAEHKFLEGDDYDLTFACGEITAAGKYPIACTFKGNLNYDVIFTGGSWASGGSDTGSCGTLTVNKTPYDMSGVVFTGTEVVYDGAEHLITVKGLPNGVTAEVVYVLDGIERAGAVNVGVYGVTVTFVGDGNHEDIPAMYTTLTVKKARLTVTANDSTVVYGDEPVANGVSYNGFVNGESQTTAGIFGGALAFEFGYVAGGNAGSYRLTPKGLTSENYEIIFVPGVLTVEKRTITVHWFNDETMSSDTLKYTQDGLSHLPYAEAGNVISGDRVVLTVSGAQTAAGINYRAEVTAVSNSNYKLPKDGATVGFDIIPSAYVIVWESAPFVYNGEEQKPGAYYFTANGERVELNVSVNGGAAVRAGTYTAVATLAGGNVTLTGESEHEFTIQKRKVSVIINNVTAEYGDTVTFNGWRYADGSQTFVGGEPIFLTSSVTVNSTVGKYAITGICTDSSNYDVTFTNGVYTVEKATVFAPELTDKIYNGQRLTADIPAGKYIVVFNDGGIDAGVYRVVIQLADYVNTRWSDTTLAAITLEFNILQAENEWTTEFEVRGTVVAGSGNMYITRPEPKFGNASAVVIKYFSDSACTKEITEEYVKTEAPQGTYYAQVSLAGTANYGELISVYSFTVTGTLSVKLNWTNKDLVYNGEEQAPVAYVWLNGEQIFLTVSGANKNAGTYTAETDMQAVDGTDLSGYVFDESGESTSIEYVIKPRSLTVHIDDDAESVYGALTIDVNRLNWTVTQGSVMAGDDLDITFTCEVNDVQTAEAGKYPIIPSCGNANYDVTFRGSWGSDDELNGKAATYTVSKANISVSKNSSTWFDEDGVIDRFQNYFITLGEKDESGEYKYLTLKGGKTATVTYSVNIDKYDATLHDGMTIAQIMQMFAVGEQSNAPEIKQAGSWVVYYRIEAESHETKYGIWKVRIEPKDKYVTVTFLKPYTVTYGETVKGKNLLPELLDGGYLEIGGAFKNDAADYEQLKLLARAFAYEDVSETDGFVDVNSDVRKYVIRLSFTEAALQNPMYANLEFKYSATNEPNSDTNLDKYEVNARKITAEWGEKSFEYDGEEHIPSVTLKGFIPVDGVGSTVKLDELKLGQTTQIELANGDIINVTVKIFSGTDAVNAGTFGIKISIDNANYKLDENTDAVTVVITMPPEPEPEGFRMPVWAIAAIAGGFALMLLLIIILIAVKRRGSSVAGGGYIDEDGFTEDYSEELDKE